MRGPCNGPTKRLTARGATRLAASRYLWRAVRPRMATCWRPSRKRCCSCTAEPASLRRLQERRTLQVREPTSPAECRALDQRGRKRWRPGTMRRLQRRPGLPPQAAADARAARGAQRAKPTRGQRRQTQSPPPAPGEQRDPLQAMREVDLAHELRRRVYTLQSPPGPMRGALKAALTAGLTEVQRDPSSAEGWKFFLLAPRMLLYRGRGETRVPRAELDKRVALLAAKQCRDLLDAAAKAAAGSDVSGPSRANAADDDAQRRAERAAALPHLGELSAASAALTAMPMAPASLEALAALRDPERRPPTRQVPLPPDFRSSHPRDPLALNSQRFLRNVRSGRRGAAAGPSGCTAEHHRVFFFSRAPFLHRLGLSPPKTLLKGSRRAREAHKPFVPRGPPAVRSAASRQAAG